MMTFQILLSSTNRSAPHLHFPLLYLSNPQCQTSQSGPLLPSLSLYCFLQMAFSLHLSFSAPVPPSHLFLTLFTCICRQRSLILSNCMYQQVAGQTLDMFSFFSKSLDSIMPLSQQHLIDFTVHQVQSSTLRYVLTWKWMYRMYCIILYIILHYMCARFILEWN